MLNHLSFGVSDLPRSQAFYDAVLGALGYARLWSTQGATGYGYPGSTDEPFAIKQEAPDAGLGSSVRTHLAFTATTRAAVAGFHSAALACGGTDLGQPGLRPQYGPSYFAAFVLDPDGYRIEAVCHAAV